MKVLSGRDRWWQIGDALVKIKTGGGREARLVIARPHGKTIEMSAADLPANASNEEIQDYLRRREEGQAC